MSPQIISVILDGSGTGTKLACQPLLSVIIRLGVSTITDSGCMVNAKTVCSVKSGTAERVIDVFVEIGDKSMAL